LVSVNEFSESTDQQVIDWEERLEMAGPFGDLTVLLDLYAQAPSNAPSKEFLGDWLRVNGYNIRGVR
jgi:hypothetical protein